MKQVIEPFKVLCRTIYFTSVLILYIRSSSDESVYTLGFIRPPPSGLFLTDSARKQAGDPDNTAVLPPSHILQGLTALWMFMFWLIWDGHEVHVSLTLCCTLLSVILSKMYTSGKWCVRQWFTDWKGVISNPSITKLLLPHLFGCSVESRLIWLWIKVSANHQMQICTDD